MGGSVNVFIQDKNRKFYKMTRWTNTISSYLDFIGHIDEDKNLKEYLYEWLKMKKDWDENSPNGPFTHPMTQFYFPSPTKICEEEYGLVFVDYITKQIISYQDYTHPGVFGLATVKVRFDEDKIELMFAAAKNRKLSFFSYSDPKQKIKPIEDKKHLWILLSSDDTSQNFIIDNSPWKIYHFSTVQISFRKIKNKIQKILEE